MPEVSKMTIVFRGIAVLHQNTEQNQMEIGVLETAGHIPRISTIENGVISKVFDLRLHPAFDDKVNFNWRLEINGIEPNARIYTNGSIGFNRKTHPDARDFRWVTDLESSEFYDRNLADELDTAKLFPIFQVPYGEFYTRLKTLSLNRKRGKNGEFQDFGCIGGVTGCDIELPIDANIKVVVPKTETTVFTCKNEPNTIYEFSNSPPDIALQPDHNGHGHLSPDHFQNYYAMFKAEPQDKFEFQMPDPDPAPDPLLCGATSLGRRGGPLRP